MSFTVSLANHFQKGKDFLHFQQDLKKWCQITSSICFRSILMHFPGNVEAVLAVLDTDEMHDPGLFHWAQIDLSLRGCTERLCSVAEAVHFIQIAQWICHPTYIDIMGFDLFEPLCKFNPKMDISKNSQGTQYESLD